MIYLNRYFNRIASAVTPDELVYLYPEKERLKNRKFTSAQKGVNDDD